MQAWKSLQKDLDSRRYKSNPFEQKYVDLTTSSYAAESTSTEEILDLEYLSKSIRARSDIITCQIAYLLKEATDVTETFGGASAKNNPQRKSTPINEGLSNESDYFVDPGQLIHYQQRDKIDLYEKDLPNLMRSITMGDDLLWINNLIKLLGPSKVEDIASEFYFTDITYIRPSRDLQKKLSSRTDPAPTNSRSTESFLLSK